MNRKDAERAVQLYREIDMLHQMRDRRIAELRSIGFSVGEAPRTNKAPVDVRELVETPKPATLDDIRKEIDKISAGVAARPLGR